MLVVNPIIGHRGACAYAPENTMASFKKALAMGCRFVEFDVMLSADGEPFVFHDDALKRTSNGRGDVGLVASSYLKTLDAGSWFSSYFKGEPIPQFKEVLAWLVAEEVQANIEIKPYPGTDEQTAIKVLTDVTCFWPSDKPLPLLSSFSWNALQMCRNLAPEMPLGLLLDSWDSEWLSKAKRLACFSVHLNHRALTESRVKEIKEAGFVLYAYTVNRQRLAKKLLRWGVDAVFSDYPDLLA